MRRLCAPLSLLVALFWQGMAFAQAPADPPKPRAEPPAAQPSDPPADAVADTDLDAESEAEAEAEEADDEAVDDGEAESRSTDNADPTLRYSTDLTDHQLEELFVAGAKELGSVSVGFADEGRLINAATLPEGDAWEVVVPSNAWGTQEAVQALVQAANAVRAKFPEAQKLRINHISKKEGGYLRPHKSHQSGRDVDLGFFYKDNLAPTAVTGNRADAMSLPENWHLLRELLVNADVHAILVDKKIRQRLYDYALSVGEDPTWLGQVFGRVIQHARRHKDHFHVRFYAPRSQELGRRIQPILAKRPDENLMVYRIRSGDTLGHIAARFGSTVSMIQKANRMSNSFLRVSRSLVVPLRGPCTRCPLPPPVTVPERRLPPQVVETAQAIEPAQALQADVVDAPPSHAAARQ